MLLFKFSGRSIYKGTCEINTTYFPFEPSLYTIHLNHYKRNLLKQLENNNTSILTNFNLIEEYNRLI